MKYCVIFIATAFSLTVLSLAPLLFADEVADAQQSQDDTIVEAVLRLQGFDLNSSEKAKAAVLRYLKRNYGSERYFQIVERFELRESAADLLRLAIEKPNETEGVRAAKLLLKLGELKRLKKTIDGENQEQAAAVVTALGLSGERTVLAMLTPLVSDAERTVAVRAAAAKALGRNRNGEQTLLALVREKKLPEDLNFTVANILLTSADESVRNEASKHLTLPAAAGSKPLPPVSDLVKLAGDVKHGQEMFKTTGTCIKCHVVRTEGKDVGPNLSEIGSKLSREALFVSILDPSAGISHNYETYQAILESGTVVSGVKLSETADSVTLKTAEAIVHEIPKDEIELLKKQTISLMPTGLVQTLTKQDLVDIVAFLQTLRKKE